MTLRLALVVLLVGALATLGVLDIAGGRMPTGVASILLATANGILLR